jgi:sugar phosphate isomerase/epimerase
MTSNSRHSKAGCRSTFCWKVPIQSSCRLNWTLYWITRAGFDPVRYFERYPGRFKLVHVKDSAGPPAHRVADVGAGAIDWGKLFSHPGVAGIGHYFVEHDEPADPFASAAAGYAYLRDLRF